MKANKINELAAEMVAALEEGKLKALMTSEAYDWQYCQPLDKDERISAGVVPSVSVGSNGKYISINITVHPNDEQAAVWEKAFNDLKARNYCLLAVEAKLESQVKAGEADKLLNKAAERLGIPVEKVEETITNQMEG